MWTSSWPSQRTGHFPRDAFGRLKQLTAARSLLQNLVRCFLHLLVWLFVCLFVFGVRPLVGLWFVLVGFRLVLFSLFLCKCFIMWTELLPDFWTELLPVFWTTWSMSCCATRSWVFSDFSYLAGTWSERFDFYLGNFHLLLVGKTGLTMRT